MTGYPVQRWKIAPPQTETATELARLASGHWQSQSLSLSPLLAQVLLNRGIETYAEAIAHISPELEALPPPVAEFPDLEQSVGLLQEAIAKGEKIAICGDYDADGMTSTALLLRALRHLGADVDYAIPSRMKDGYGINERIVEEFAASGVGLILTVDNGIAAYDAILHAVELGVSVIVTDHHEPPETLPPADAILNPKLIAPESPYRGLAGVGVAYILAVTTARELGRLEGLTAPLLELFTLGTIADLAPLVGVNRRWLKRGLKLLPQSQLAGVSALMQVAGVNDTQKSVKPEDIGFRLGPRINAIGRIGDPQIVIELLTTDDPGVALEKAMQCEQANRERQHLCEMIQEEAIAYIESELQNWQQRRVLVVVRPQWHHGVIGIVASRLVERYGVPVFIGTYEDEAGETIRGSARGIPEFHVFEALDACGEFLDKYGGHKAAGGFSLATENLIAFEECLSAFACQCLAPEHLKPLVNIDVLANFEQLDGDFYRQIDDLNPWGIENSEPIFWTPNVQVVDQRIVGKNHLKLSLRDSYNGDNVEMKAIAWRWGERCPRLPQIDIAFKLRENTWQGNVAIELELVGLRPSEAIADFHPSTNLALNRTSYAYQQAEFIFCGRTYVCRLREGLNELRIKNPQGKILTVSKGKRLGVLRKSSREQEQVDVTRSPYYQIVKAAVAALKKASN